MDCGARLCPGDLAIELRTSRGSRYYYTAAEKSVGVSVGRFGCFEKLSLLRSQIVRTLFEGQWLEIKYF